MRRRRAIAAALVIFAIELTATAAGLASEPDRAAAFAKGQSLYRAKCQRCHGVDGRGRGPEDDPDRPAASLTAARSPDLAMFYTVWNGRAKSRMPAMKTDLTPADVWMVIAYVKTLRK